MKILALLPVATLPAPRLLAFASVALAVFALPLLGLGDARADEPATATAKAETDEPATPDDKKDAKEKEEAQKAAAAAKKRAESKKAAAKKSKKVRYAHFVLKSSIPESPGQKGPFGDLQTDLRKTINRFEKAAEDDSIEGIVLDLRNPSVGRGRINELRSAIRKFRESGKQVHAQLEIATPTDYLIAAACDEISMPETGFLLLPGVRLEPTFYKGLLTKMGVKADFLHMGDAKGAGEAYTRKKWSEPVRANLDAMAGDLFEQMIEMIALDRPVTEAKVREMVDLALITAGQAQEAGLIDRVAYADEVRTTLDESHGADRLVYVQNYGRKSVDTDFSGPAGFFKLMQAIVGDKPTTGRRAGKKIAVVYAVGPIMTGESEEDLFGGGTIGSATLVEALAEAADNDQVAAIVLRVDSPGGSAVASDVIWRQIQKIEQPVVASMGDVAASGGYYISMGADKIFAEPGTITGSIGVVSGKFAFRGMYKKLGLTTDLITRGENSGIFSGMRRWSDSERAAMMRMMEETYEQFTGKAAAGRGMPIEQLKSLASGKVYTGRQAKANGLVDEIGTLADAIAEAKKLAGLEEDDKVRIETLPEAPDFFESLFGNAGKEKEVRVSLDGVAVPAEVIRAARQIGVWSRLLEREPVGLFVPFDLSVE